MLQTKTPFSLLLENYFQPRFCHKKLKCQSLIRIRCARHICEWIKQLQLKNQYQAEPFLVFEPKKNGAHKHRHRRRARKFFNGNPMWCHAELKMNQNHPIQTIHSFISFWRDAQPPKITTRYFNESSAAFVCRKDKVRFYQKARANERASERASERTRCERTLLVS